MKINKEARKLAEDLDLSPVDAYLMHLKSQLYQKCAELINESQLTHEEIAGLVGTSRARITRLANMGESSVSLELLIKVIAILEDKVPLKAVV